MSPCGTFADKLSERWSSNFPRTVLRGAGEGGERSEAGEGVIKRVRASSISPLSAQAIDPRNAIYEGWLMVRERLAIRTGHVVEQRRGKLTRAAAGFRPA